MLQILIADDHPIFRNGLKQILAEEEGMNVKGEASDGYEALKLLETNTYDALVLDLDMPGISGLDVLKQAKTLYSKLPVLILSFFPEEQYALRALKLGASGYLTKESAVSELVDALHRIIQGKRYVTATLAERLAGSIDSDVERPHEQLSDREYQVFSMITEGKTSSDISNELNLSPKTVSTYKGRVYEKLKVENDVQLVRYAIREGLIR